VTDGDGGDGQVSRRNSSSDLPLLQTWKSSVTSVTRPESPAMSGGSGCRTPPSPSATVSRAAPARPGREGRTPAVHLHQVPEGVSEPRPLGADAIAAPVVCSHPALGGDCAERAFPSLPLPHGPGSSEPGPVADLRPEGGPAGLARLPEAHASRVVGSGVVSIGRLLCALIAALRVASITMGGWIGAETRVRGIDLAVEAGIGAIEVPSSGTHPGIGYAYDETASDRANQYNGRIYDPGTGFHNYGARMYWPQIGRFISADPAGMHPENPQSLNRYAYVWNNPYKFIDPDGKDVTILINRETYSGVTVTGTASISSTVAGAGTFNGYTLETATAGPNGNKDPIPAGTYSAFERTDHSPHRVELQNVPGATNIQVHVGNTAADVEGCFALGSTRQTDYVGGSTAAVQAMLDIIHKDGSGNITVVVNGAPTTTGQLSAPVPEPELVQPPPPQISQDVLPPIQHP
jgi:RHS repeat-associated protein